MARSESDLKLALNKEYLQEEKEKEAYSLSDMLRMIGDVKDYFTPRRGKRWDAENAAIRLIIENMQLINEFLVVDAVLLYEPSLVEIPGGQ